MSSKDRYNVFPSRMAQTIMKGRLKGAQTGHSLLKKSGCINNAFSINIKENY